MALIITDDCTACDACKPVCPNDAIAVGDPIFVMVTDIDQQGRINLSRKDALAAIAKKRAEAAQQ